VNESTLIRNQRLAEMLLELEKVAESATWELLMLEGSIDDAIRSCVL